MLSLRRLEVCDQALHLFVLVHDRWYERIRRLALPRLLCNLEAQMSCYHRQREPSRLAQALRFSFSAYGWPRNLRLRVFACVSPVVLLFELLEEPCRDIWRLVARKLVQVKAVELCSPVIYALLSDHHFLAGVQSLILRGHKRLLAPVFARALGLLTALLLWSWIVVYSPLCFHCRLPGSLL